MLLLLLKLFSNTFGWNIPAVFSYSSTRMMLAAFTSLVLTIFIGPFFIKKLYELKIGQSIRDASEVPLLAELHKKKKDTPTMGGVLILSSMVVSLFLWMDLTSIYTWILLFTTLGLGLIGGVDDYLKLKRKNSVGLRPKIKFLGQILVAGSLSLYLLCPICSSLLSGKEFFLPPKAKEFHKVVDSVSKQVSYTSSNLDTKELMGRLYIPFKKHPLFTLHGFLLLFSFVFFICVIVGSSNAVNLTDGLDGLASGLLVLVACVLALFAFLSNNAQMAKYLNILYIEGSGEIAIYLLALAGATLGFLWYNGFPAQVFMGDVGSLSLGGLIGVSAVLLRREVLLAIVGAIFVAEALSVILQVYSYRYRNKKRIFLCAPLHHHFEYKGWPETKVVLRFWIIGLLLALVGIASLKFQ